MTVFGTEHKWVTGTALAVRPLRRSVEMIQASRRCDEKEKIPRGAIAIIAALSFNLVWSGASGATEQTTRVEGVIEAVHSPNAIVLRTETTRVTVDLAQLGGVTVAVEPGQTIAAVGVMEPTGTLLHATTLEPMNSGKPPSLY